MPILTANAAENHPDGDPYAAYRFQYRTLIDSVSSVLHKAARLTGRN